MFSFIIHNFDTIFEVVNFKLQLTLKITVITYKVCIVKTILCHVKCPMSQSQNIITSKPLRARELTFERMFTPQHVSYVTCHVSQDHQIVEDWSSVNTDLQTNPSLWMEVQ